MATVVKQIMLIDICNVLPNAPVRAISAYSGFYHQLQLWHNKAAKGVIVFRLLSSAQAFAQSVPTKHNSFS